MGGAADGRLASRPSPWVWGALVVQTLISAGTYLAAKRAMAELAPTELVLLRLLLSAPVFAAVLAFTKGPVLPPLRALPGLLVLGLLAGPINQGLFLFGLSRSEPTHAALLYALTPIGVYLLSMALGREGLKALRLSGIAVALFGVAVLLLGGGLEAAAGPRTGDLYILAAVAAWVTYTTEGKRLAATFGPIRSSCWSLIAGSLWLAPFAPSWLDVQSLRSASATTLGCVLYLVLLTSVVSYLLWYYALARVEASRVAVFANLQPVATAVAAWALLGDPLASEVLLGGGLVLLGVRLAQR
ncbi:MAG: DMT family transporter [Myxococcales bacterium]|nr:DMT family transporter [Myxococcales bacterium]